MTSIPLLALIVAVSSSSAGASAAPDADKTSIDLVAMASTHFDFDPAAETTGQIPEPTATAPAETDSGHKPFGTTGTARWNVFASLSSDFNNAITPQMNLGLSYFIAPYLSLDVTVDGLYEDQDGPNAFGAGFTLLFRWHAIHHDTWTIYMDGGAGMLFSNEDIPADASRVNFTPQIGVGASVDLGCDTRLMTGLRWYHISNANTAIDNGGRDQLMGYLGLSFPF